MTVYLGTDYIPEESDEPEQFYDSDEEERYWLHMAQQQDDDWTDPDDDPRTHSEECLCEHCLQNHPERMYLLEDDTDEEPQP